MRAIFTLAIGALLMACAPTTSSTTETQTTASTAAAANGAVAAPTPSDVAIHIKQDQNGQTVTVPVNQRFAVELVGVPTAGYLWAPTTLPAFLTRAGEAGGDTSTAQSQPGFTGGNHWEVFMFSATGPGRGELVLEQRRPWEHNEPASQTFRVTIVAQ